MSVSLYELLSKCFNMDGIVYEEFQADRINTIHEDLKDYNMNTIVLRTTTH